MSRVRTYRSWNIRAQFSWVIKFTLFNFILFCCSSASPICSFYIDYYSRLIQSDTTTISTKYLLQYILINWTFTSMVWDDCMLSTDFLLNSNQLKLFKKNSELSYKLHHNAQCFHLTCILRYRSGVFSLVSSKPVTSSDYVHRFVLDVTFGNMDILCIILFSLISVNVIKLNWQCRVNMTEEVKIRGPDKPIEVSHLLWNHSDWFKLVTSIIQFKCFNSKNQIKRAIHFLILTSLVMNLTITNNDGWNKFSKLPNQLN